MSYTPVWIASPFDHVHYAIVRNQFELDYLLQGKGKAQFNTDTPACMSTWKVPNDRTYCIIQIGHTWEWTIPCLATVLVHECVHIWQTTKEAMAEDNPSSEFEAYSIDSIFKHMLGQYLLSESASFSYKKGRHILSRKRANQ